MPAPLPPSLFEKIKEEEGLLRVLFFRVMGVCFVNGVSGVFG